MLDRRGPRFMLEVVFLAALAAGLALARLDPLEIAGLELAGWVVVAALEWAAWRGEPHFGSGLPPRYFVPQVALPPPRPLDRVAPGYPEAARDEAPTWIATPALRSQVLGEWPGAAPVVAAPAVAAPVVAPEPEPVTVIELPPPVPDPEPEPEPPPAAGRPTVRFSRYSFDPLAEPARRRRNRRPGEGSGLDVPSRPDGPRPLPRR